MVWIRRGAVVGAAVVTGLVGLVPAAGPAAAALPARCDFDGDGRNDLAIGAPGENERGAVNVQYQRTGYLSDPAILREDWLPLGAAYGAALVCGDFNGIGADDLVVGAPRADDGRGRVFVYSGQTGTGLSSASMVNFGQGTLIAGSAEDHDRFGWSLASGDLFGDGIDDLAIGVPGDRVTGVSADQRVGSVVVVHGGSSGLRYDASVEQLVGWWQTDRREVEDSDFGWSVEIAQFVPGGSKELAVGAPDADVPDGGSFLPSAGRVYTFRDANELIAHQVLAQDDVGLPPGSEPYDNFGWDLAAGDFDGDGAQDLAVGTPLEDVGGVVDAGEVSVFGGGAGGLGSGGTDTVVQSQAGGRVDESDWFGWSVAAGDYDADGRADLAVGAPGEDVGETSAAGAVSVVRGDPTLLGGPANMLSQGVAALPDSSEANDYFGYSVAAVGLLGKADLIIGVPGQEAPAALPGGNIAGAVVLTVGWPKQGPVSDPSFMIHQDSGVPYDVADQREPAYSLMPYDFIPGENLDGPTHEPTGEWFGWAIAS